MDNGWMFVFWIPAFFIILPFAIITSNANFNGHQLVTVLLAVSIVPLGIVLFAFVDWIIFRIQWFFTFRDRGN